MGMGQPRNLNLGIEGHAWTGGAIPSLSVRAN